MYLNNTYYVKQNAVSKEIYNKIIKLGQNKKFKKGEILEGNQNNRSSKISWILAIIFLYYLLIINQKCQLN